MLEPYVVAAAITSASVGRSIFIKDAKHVKVTLATTGLVPGRSVSVNFKASDQELAPNFATAKSATNMWDYIEVIRQADGTPIDGVTGDTIAGSDDVRTYELNTNGATWFTVDLNTFVGAVTINGTAMLFDNRN